MKSGVSRRTPHGSSKVCLKYKIPFKQQPILEADHLFIHKYSFNLSTYMHAQLQLGLPRQVRTHFAIRILEALRDRLAVV